MSSENHAQILDEKLVKAIEKTEPIDSVSDFSAWPRHFLQVVLAKCPLRRHLGLCLMAKLKSFSMAGVDLWFWPNDHEPPHFHAKRRGEWELRVKFLEPRETMLEMKWQKSRKSSISARDKKKLVEMVESHRIEILREWEQKVNQP